MSSFFIGAKNRVLKGEAAPKGKGQRGQGKGFPKGKALSRKGQRALASPVFKGNRL